MHFSDVEVGKQLIVGNGTYYDALGLGGKAIRGSAYIEGPFLTGDAKSFGGVVATTMIARDVNEESNNPSRSLHVKGNTFLQGDGGTANGLYVSGGIHSCSVDAVYIQGDLYVSGSTDTGNKGRLASRFATADAKPKPFDLVHPTKGQGHRLRYACIEGPEVGVYYRGRLKNDTEIVLPNYWKDLVHVDSITVQLQPIGAHQDIIVKRWDDEKIYLQAKPGFPINCFYHVYAERKDINPLIVEYKGDSWKDYPDPNFNPEKVDEDERTYTDPRFAGPQNTFTG
ncbi:MAG: hypothetical protein CM15mL2_0300 [Caudoviricetes sp.]|nr:MAG: hypothetical protein CM15mL2_0300 [Caudoviricetes sp.]